MSFRCERCGTAQSDRTRPVQTVTAIERGPWNGQRFVGFRILREEKLCADCAATVECKEIERSAYASTLGSRSLTLRNAHQLAHDANYEAVDGKRLGEIFDGD